MDILVSLVVAAGTLVLGFLIGRIDVFINARYDAYRARIEEFYSPVYALHYRLTYGCAYDFLDFPIEAQRKIAELIIEKSIYADKDLQETITVFIWVCKIQFNAPSSMSSDDKATINKEYRAIVIRASRECMSAMGRMLSPKFSDLFAIAFKRLPDSAYGDNRERKQHIAHNNNDQEEGKNST